MKKRILKLWIFFAKKICCPFVNISIFVVLLIDYEDSKILFSDWMFISQFFY